VSRDCEDFAVLAAARALSVLDEAEEAELDQHLASCPACPDLARELEERLAREAAVEPIALPEDGWRRIQEGLARAKAAASAGANVFVRVRCSYCHGALERDAAVFCASCLAPGHRECFAEHGRCPAQGCDETRIIEPTVQKPARPRRTRLLPVLAVLVGGGVAAAALAPSRRPANEAPSTLRQDAVKIPDPLGVEAIIGSATPDRIVEAKERAQKIRDESLERARNADSEAARFVSEEIRKERAFLEDKARGGTMAIMNGLSAAGTHPYSLVGSAEKFGELFHRYAKGVAVEGSAATSLKDLRDGMTLTYGEGSFSLDVRDRGDHEPLPKDLTIRGAGMDKTLLTLDELSSNDEVTNLTFEDMTIDCGDNYLTDLRSENPITLHLVRCRVVGFDMGAGGSVMLAAERAAFWAEDCHFEAGYGRTPAGFGNLFRVRDGLLARLDRCVFDGLFRSVYDTNQAATYVFTRCRFENVSERSIRDTRDGVHFEACSETLAPSDAVCRVKRHLGDLNPLWKNRNR
jgi:hypothetical protein